MASKNTNSPVIIIALGERRRLIPLPLSYDSLIEKSRESFNTPRADFLVYFTPSFSNDEVELDPAAYDSITDKCVLRLEKLPSIHHETSEDPKAKRPRKWNDEVDRINITVKTLTGESLILLCSPIMTVGDLKDMIQSYDDVPPDQQRLIFDGQHLEEDGQNLLSCGIRHRSTVYLTLGLRVAKPAIYLMSPTHLYVTVSVTLSHHWEFSLIYPLADAIPIHSEHSTVSWEVAVDTNGTLKDTATGVQCSCLFWEAKTISSRRDILGTIRSDYPFNPFTPCLERDGENALVLPFADFVPYLERTLAALTLTPAMQIEFVGYWLPKFQKIRDRGLDIAFDFVPQDDFDEVANLDVLPQPEIVARIFLIFDGVAKSENATMSTEELEAIDWPARVGFDEDLMRDALAFRVLEWGGMEARMA